MNKSARLFSKIGIFILLPLSFFFFNSCDKLQNNKATVTSESRADSEEMFTFTMERHLNAVSNRDLERLKSTLSPEGNMQLILPGTEITHTVDEFMKYHENWFKETGWTFDTKILNTVVGEEMGIAITEVVYREAERDGKPYFNRMNVSYALKKIAGKWYVIKDHASSVEKSTD